MAGPPLVMRSKLFVPGDRPERFPKAMATAADAISLDLEDAVHADRKAAARIAVGEWLRSRRDGGDGGKLVMVRVNPVGSAGFAADLEAVVGPGLAAVNLPKVESAEEVRAGVAAIIAVERTRRDAPETRVLVNIESPRGLRLAHEIAQAHPRVVGLQIGFGDLFAPFGIRRSIASLAPVWLAVRLAAGEAGIQAFDGAYTDIANADGLAAEAAAARGFGLHGKSAIHPSQVEAINAAFAPSPAEVRHACEVVAALADPANRSKGAFTVDGRLIDGPFIAEALATHALARRLGLAP